MEEREEEERGGREKGGGEQRGWRLKSEVRVLAMFQCKDETEKKT